MQTLCHLSHLPYEQAKKYKARTAFEYQDYDSEAWKSISWMEFAQKVHRVSMALLTLGVEVQENIGVFSQNCLPYLLTDYGAFGVRAVTIPFYATSSEQQLQYVINDAGIRFIFVGEQEQYDKARRVQALCATLERIIVFDHAVIMADHDTTSITFDDFMTLKGIEEKAGEVSERLEQCSYDDLINILYTSGTTGEAKGVMLTYGQFNAALKANDECVPLGENDRVITFLPITHIFERGWMTLALTEGAVVIINTNPHRIQLSMRETHPTAMSAVPRFWEKVYATVQSKIDQAPAMQKKLFHEALQVGYKVNVELKSQGKKPPLALALKYKVISATLLSIVRKQLGLERPNIFPTAGALVSRDVETFVKSLGIEMIVGYGLTESLATVSCDHKGKPFTVGSVGRVITGVDVKIGENNEILLKGPTITRGYYHREALNKEAFTEDGYFKTGDSGYLKDGELFLTERIKDLYKTSNGKYVAPQLVEATLLVDKYIEQVVAIADERKFVSALIVPAYAMLEEYARQYGISFNTRADLCSNEKIRAMLAERMATLQQGLAGYEQVKRFTLIDQPFTMERGELTNTLKIRRNVVIKSYADVIDKMYED